ncbi:hypothetical protein [Mesorhizobium sp. INR15]|uniref:hypothetical protein n=1 Tax=Mesorhizobium sp. INR15 TaxID=2654248 RepID=UPI0018966C22|nr:hypothetical protein [Mesorhizobium sp. INR15]QPC90601.1 hypothetical protein GA829_08320 [Mesorhizobium sp. INR15]
MGLKLFKGVVDLLNQNRPVRKLKAFRNALIEGNFRARGTAEGLKFAEQLRQTGSRRSCFVIAFNTPWVIDALTQAWQLHSSGMTLVVVDNSSNKSARTIIASICQARGVAYFPLPRNWEINPNRSHGTAMNWIFHNIVRPLRPEFFGFLDHDCFPITAVDIPSRLEGKTVYGTKYQAKPGHEGWFLWAGFCFYRFSSVEDLDMDFTPRFIDGMDTGGGNWTVLYRRLHDDAVADEARTTIRLNLDGTQADHVAMGGAFFHVGGASYRGLINTKHYRRLMSDHLWDTYLGGRDNRIVKDL